MPKGFHDPFSSNNDFFLWESRVKLTMGNKTKSLLVNRGTKYLGSMIPSTKGTNQTLPVTRVSCKP